MILSFLTSFLYAQTEPINTTQNSDSLKTNINQHSLNTIQILFDEFDLYREFNSMKMNVPIDGDPQTVWLRTSLAIANTENTNQNFSPYFLAPLQREYYEDSKFDPIRSILGMAQAGAVGYLAYKHIKKYGFLK
ncbi:MAG: hypothetical protein ABI638_00585 [Ignavibacteriota bacterium]